jgi:hypothetical protein
MTPRVDVTRDSVAGGRPLPLVAAQQIVGARFLLRALAPRRGLLGKNVDEFGMGLVQVLRRVDVAALERLELVRRNVPNSSIAEPEIVLTPISPSFHACDVLAPAAAHLAAGADLEMLGRALDPATLAELTIPEPTVERGTIECEVPDLNRFGNVPLNVRESELAESGLDGSDAIQVDATSGSGQARRMSTYADVESREWV